MNLKRPKLRIPLIGKPWDSGYVVSSCDRGHACRKLRDDAQTYVISFLACECPGGNDAFPDLRGFRVNQLEYSEEAGHGGTALLSQVLKRLMKKDPSPKPP